MRIAIVHDYLTEMGGAERVVEVLHRLYPSAPIYTSAVSYNLLPSSLRHADIRPSILQQIPGVRRLRKPLLPAYPGLFGRMKLSGYDVVVASSSAFAHGVKVEGGRLICYCYTPPRFLWNSSEYLRYERVPGLVKTMAGATANILRRWDIRAASRVDAYVGISKCVAKRIQTCYGRHAQVVYPPVDVRRFTPVADKEPYFVVVSRLVAYKRIDLVVSAFNHLRLPLIIIGDGPARLSLQKVARPNIRFLGRLPDSQVAGLLSRATALIFPGEEDFGIVPLEANACGTPVVAFASGGALETQIDGVTGTLFHEQNYEALMDAVHVTARTRYNDALLRRNAEQFSEERFSENFASVVSGSQPTT